MRHGEGIVLRELRWDDTAPSIIEKVIAAEVVHPFAFPALSSVRQRLQPTARDRHLYCFYHEGIGFDEPLIAVQVALTKGVSGSVDTILGRKVLNSPSRNEVASSGGELSTSSSSLPSSSSTSFDTAIFYSINSAQVGLKGVDLGNSLIKAVVKHLQTTHNDNQLQQQHADDDHNNSNNSLKLKYFSTLSPIPSYVPWLAKEVEKITKVLLNSVEGATLGLNATLASDAEFVDIHNPRHLDALAEAIVVSKSTIFGPRVVRHYVASLHGEDGGKKMTSSMANNSAGAQQQTKAIWDKEEGESANTKHLFSSQFNLEPPSIVCEKKARRWLGQISDAVRLFHFNQQKKDRRKYSNNVLEALVEMLAMPAPPVSGKSTTTETKRTKQKKDPIAALHDMPEDFVRSVRNGSIVVLGGGENANSSSEIDAADWWSNPEITECLRAPLTHSISCFLTCEKRKGTKIYDPVGNFHVSNGAVVWRINWLANQTAKGSAESACCMVNYWYDLANNASNARGYELAHAVPVGKPIGMLWERHTGVTGGICV